MQERTCGGSRIDIGIRKTPLKTRSQIAGPLQNKQTMDYKKNGRKTPLNGIEELEASIRPET